MSKFDAKGYDKHTYAPFVLQDCRALKWKDVRLTFDDWDHIKKLCGAESELDGYYLNGYGVEGVVKGAMVDAGIDVDSDEIDCNSEGDTCNIHFKVLEVAVTAAKAAVAAFATKKALLAAIKCARQHGFED